MSMRCAKVLNILILLGFLFIIFGFLFLFSDRTLIPSNIAILSYLICQSIIGGFIGFCAITKTKRPYHVFSGSLILVCGLVSILFVFCPDIKFSSVWPLYAVFPGLNLILVSCYKYKKLKLNYGIPGLILLIMSLYYFLFSFKLIKVSFTFVSYFVAPVLIVGILVIFVLFYFLQKDHKELVLKDDDSDDFAEEEYPFPDEEL